MTVPTPLTWSTWTAIARCPTGTWTSMIAPVKPPLRVVAVIWAPVATGWRAIWPTTCDTSVKAPGLIAVEGDDLGRHLVGADPRRQRDVGWRRRRPDPRSGGLSCPSPAALRTRSRIPTKATIARKTPTSRTSRFERFKLILPDEWCDRWHHSSTAQRARDYTKGLGPLGRKRQEITHDARKTARLRRRAAHRPARGVPDKENGPPDGGPTGR